MPRPPSSSNPTQPFAAPFAATPPRALTRTRSEGSLGSSSSWRSEPAAYGAPSGLPSHPAPAADAARGSSPAPRAPARSAEGNRASIAPPPAALRGPSSAEPHRGAETPRVQGSHAPIRSADLRAAAAQPGHAPERLHQRLDQDLAALHKVAAEGGGLGTRAWIRTKRIFLGMGHGALLGSVKLGRKAIAPKDPNTSGLARVGAGFGALVSAGIFISNGYIFGIPSILGTLAGLGYGIYDSRGERLTKLAVRRQAKSLIARLDKDLKATLYGSDGNVRPEIRNDPSIAAHLATTIQRLQNDPAIVGAVKARHVKPLQAHLDRLQAPPPVVAGGWGSWNPSAPAGYPQPPAGYPQPQAGYPQPPAGYPQPQAGYPQPPAGYPQPPAGYPQPPAGYPQPPAGYPQPPAGYSQPGAHAQPADYPPSASHPAQSAPAPAGYPAQHGPAPQVAAGLPPAGPSRPVSPAHDTPPLAQPVAPGGAFAPSAARGYFATPFGATGGAGPLHAGSAGLGQPAASVPTGHAATGTEAVWRR